MVKEGRKRSNNNTKEHTIRAKGRKGRGRGGEGEERERKGTEWLRVGGNGMRGDVRERNVSVY